MFMGDDDRLVIQNVNLRMHWRLTPVRKWESGLQQLLPKPILKMLPNQKPFTKICLISILFYFFIFRYQLIFKSRMKYFEIFFTNVILDKKKCYSRDKH